MGGMESHFHGLAHALRGAGHEVVSFAASGSDLPNLQAICHQPCESIYPREQFAGTDVLKNYQRDAFLNAWTCIIGDRFDVVHNNSLFPDLIDWSLRDGIPMVTSQHVPPFGSMREKVGASLNDSRQQFTVTSQHQKDFWSKDDPSNLSVVHNGIDLANWKPAMMRHDKLVWYGRITDNKGPALAAQAAAIAGCSLDIVGAIEDPHYFDAEVAPYLTQKIRYRGHLAGTELTQAVASARAVVVTPMWDEPFGLVAAEALSCGVPVLAFDRGALREIVGPCGVIVPPADIEALAEAMLARDLPASQSCRERAARCFSLDQMITGYERCYAAAITAHTKDFCDRSASSASNTTLLLA